MRIWKYFWGLLIFSLIFFFVIKPFFINEIQLSLDSEITVCKVVRWEPNVEGDGDYVFEYTVARKQYKGAFVATPNLKISIGDCFLIEYYPGNPSVARVLIEKPTKCN